jgi:CRISPR/Cas system endoribonuclease Cas6 (RAMP superfamily)
MIKEYYRVKLASFLDSQNVESVLAGTCLSAEALEYDTTLSKLDKNSVMCFSVFLSQDSKIIKDKNEEPLSFTTIESLRESIPENEQYLIESITVLEQSVNNISNVIAQFDNTTILSSLEAIVNKIAKYISYPELEQFFEDIAPNAIEKFHEIVRSKPYSDSKEEITAKMILSKMKTKITETNITYGTVKRLLTAQPENMQELQDLISFN